MSDVDPFACDGDILAPCQWGYDGCTGFGTLQLDPFAADVDNDPDALTWACDPCLTIRTDDV